MSSPDTTSQGLFSARNLKLLGAAAALLLLGIGLVSYRRGSTLSPPPIPSSIADGARCGLVAAHRVRCHVLAGTSLASVWSLISDYPRFPELFRSPFFEFELSSHEQQNDGRVRLAGAVSGLLQRYPFEIEITHQRSPQVSTATWEQLSGALSTDRGGWTLRPRSDRETLITYEIEAAMRGAPSFIINDVLLDTLPSGLEHLAELAAAKASP